jgi:predicted membrane-bound spermidine synthase
VVSLLIPLKAGFSEADNVALVTAGNDRFTYAAIFCALSALIGTLITIGPPLVDKIQQRTRKSNVAGEQEESDQAGGSKSGRTTPA